MTCKCYHAERNFLGEIGVCWGTKECEACSCHGDESKCDFYEDKRKKATPKTTNADLIRAMSVEKLAEWRSNGQCPPDHYYGDFDCSIRSCKDCWLDWLRQEVET